MKFELQSRTTALALALMLGGTTPFAAPSSAQAQVVEQGGTNLRSWNYNSLYRSAWSAERMLDNATVVGALGEDIGSVENIIVSDQGRILGIIAQVGGFWDIGDTHVFVPWKQVRVSPTLERVLVPLTEENVDDYVGVTPSYLTRTSTQRTRAVDDDLETGPRVWKVTDLVDDYAYLNRNTGYGYVRDVLFSTDGMVTGVVVNAGAGYGGGTRAFPYTGYGANWNPGAGDYNLGYNEADVRVLEPFQYNRLPQRVTMRTGAETAGMQPARGNANVTGAVPVQWTFREIDQDGNLELSDREFARVGQDIYRRWDADGDNRLVENEFYTGLYGVLDMDRDQRLTEREFNTGWRTWGRGYQRLDYTTLDADSSGYVTTDEFRQELSRIGYYNTWDADGRGYLTAGDFNSRLYNTWAAGPNRSVTRNDFGEFSNLNWF